MEKEKYPDYLNKDLQNSKFLNEIKEQATNLHSMEEYINLLENKLKNFNPNISLHITKENIIQLNGSKSLYKDSLQKKLSDQNQNKDLFNSFNQENTHQINSDNNNNKEVEYKEKKIKKLKKEINEILLQLKQGSINDEQRNNEDMLIQTLESNKMKHDSINGNNYFKNSYCQKLEKDDKGDNAYITLEINKLKEINNFLYKKTIEELNLKLEEIEMKLLSFNKLNKEYNIVIKNNEYLKNELINLENKYVQREKNIIQLNEKFINSSRSNEQLLNENNYLRCLRKDNLELMKSFSNLEVKIDQLSHDNNILKDFQERYGILLIENKEIKKINKILSEENAFIKQKVNYIEKYIKELERIDTNNILLKKKLQNSNDNLIILNCEKNKSENYYLNQLGYLLKEKKNIENILFNQKKNDNVKAIRQNISYSTNNEKLYCLIKSLNNFMIKYEFIESLIYRILEFHLPNLNAKNIIFEMINLNIKNIEINTELQNMEKKLEKILRRTEVNFEEKSKIENSILESKTQLNNLKAKFILLDEQLKAFEI